MRTIVLVCLHCRDPRKPVNRPRGLCWTCYYTPGVKEMHAPISKCGRRGVSSHNRAYPVDDEPTTTLPGTVDRLKVYAYRAAAGLQLHHPQDRV